MAIITINGVGVISGSIMLPLYGLWTADLEIDQPDGSGFATGMSVSIAVADSFTLTGTVIPYRTGDFLATVYVRCVGGAGGMINTGTPRGYSQPGATVSDVLNGFASDSGETLSPTIDSGLLGTNLVAWATMADPVSQSLDVLIDTTFPTYNWRFLPDGTLWVGAETWPADTSEYILINQDTVNGTYELGVDFPAFLPGSSISGVGNVGRVEHVFDGDSVRSIVWAQFGAQYRGIIPAISAIVQQESAGNRYLCMYDCRLASQSGDGTTVDVVPLDGALPGLQNVPLRHGLPGANVMVPPNALLRLGWDRGNPSRPFAALWNGGETVTTTTLQASTFNFNNATAINLGTSSAVHPMPLGDNLSAMLAGLATNLAVAAANPILVIIMPTTAAALLAASGVITAALPTLNSIIVKAAA